MLLPLAALPALLITAGLADFFAFNVAGAERLVLFTRLLVPDSDLCSDVVLRTIFCQALQPELAWFVVIRADCRDCNQRGLPDFQRQLFPVFGTLCRNDCRQYIASVAKIFPPYLVQCLFIPVDSGGHPYRNAQFFQPSQARCLNFHQSPCTLIP